MSGMNFSFDATAGASQSTVKPRLEGNEIYDVVFDGCEIKDIKGVKDPDALYKVLILKFSNEDGSFEHTIFEPRPEDFKRGENEFTNKNGAIEKIPQPSRVESMMLLFKHAIDALNPAVSKAIDEGKKQISAPNWEALRALIVKILDPVKGVKTKIKLVTSSKGEASFPFFSAVNRDSKAYIRNNFIGEKLAFTAYEMQKIKAAAGAKPTEMGNDPLGSNIPQGSESTMDLDFDVSGL